jgi:hypothetical protein
MPCMSLVCYCLRIHGCLLTREGETLTVVLRMQTYLHDGHTYISQLFHHVNVRDLPFGVPIYYK